MRCSETHLAQQPEVQRVVTSSRRSLSRHSTLPGAVAGAASFLLTALLLGPPPARCADADAPPGDDSPSTSAATVLRAAAVHVGDGTVYRPGEVLLRDGAIAEVGSSVAAPDDARRVEHPHGEITPALVDPDVRVSRGGDGGSGAGPAVLDAADGRSPWDPWLDELSRGGLGAACLVPTGSGPVQGRAATITTRGSGADGGAVLARPFLVTSVRGRATGSAARAAERRALRALLESAESYRDAWKRWREHEEETAGRRRERAGKKAPKKPKRNEAQEVLLEVVERRLALRMAADRVEDVREALALASERSVALTIVGCAECGELADELERSRAVVVLTPLLSPAREGPWGEPDLDLARVLADAGVRLAASGGGPWPSGPTWLRIAAAHLAGAGVDEDVALAAVTGTAAAAAGIDGEWGLVAEGRQSPIVIWSGSPLDPSSRVVDVVVPEDEREAPEGGAP